MDIILKIQAIKEPCLLFRFHKAAISQPQNVFVYEYGILMRGSTFMEANKSNGLHKTKEQILVHLLDT